MLILSRKVHQEIIIGDGISITIVAIRGKQVRVGIKAPANVPIRRDELPPLEPAPVAAKKQLVGGAR
jgi:carbon storage regulator